MGATTETCRVYVDGIWDLFHDGHIKLFKKAIQKAESLFPGREVKLIVGVCDEGVAEYKRETLMTCTERCAAIRAHNLACEVIPNCPLRIDETFLTDHCIDLVVHGDDFDEDKKQHYYGVAVEQGKYASVPYTKGISTTQMIRHVKLEGSLLTPSNHTLLEEAEIIRRIKERSWESMGMAPPPAADAAK